MNIDQCFISLKSGSPDNLRFYDSALVVNCRSKICYSIFSTLYLFMVASKNIQTVKNQSSASAYCIWTEAFEFELHVSQTSPWPCCVDYTKGEFTIYNILYNLCTGKLRTRLNHNKLKTSCKVIIGRTLYIICLTIRQTVEYDYTDVLYSRFILHISGVKLIVK